MKKLITSIAITISLTGCAGMTGTTISDLTDVASEIVSPTGADPDYTAYLRYCNAQVKAKATAAASESSAIVSALGATKDNTARGALITIAAFQASKGVDLNCNVERKIGFIEGIGASGVLGFGMELYKENRTNIRFKKQLEADAKALETNLFYNNESRKDTNQLWRDLIGTPKERSDSAIILAP